MRIAYLINSVEGGGAAAPIPAVTGLMRAHGFDVRVFALTARDGRGLPAILDAELTASVRPGGERDHYDALRWLDAGLTAWRPDILWTSLTRATLLGQIVGQRRHIPVVSWQHAAYLKPGNRMLLRMRQERSALWIADSQCVADLTASRLAVPPGRLMVWPLFRADPGAPVATPWQAGQPLRLGSLGRLHAVKGYDLLIAALAELKREGFRPPVPFELVIAGEGGERARLQAAIDAAGLIDVRLAGHTGDPRAFLAGLHLYVQPSRSEGLCIALHEAMQAGLPTLATAVGEMPFSVIDYVTGLVVPPRDETALAVGLTTLLDHPDRLAAMGAAARLRVLGRFGAESFAAAGTAIIRRLPLPREAGRRRA